MEAHIFNQSTGYRNPVSEQLHLKSELQDGQDYVKLSCLNESMRIHSYSNHHIPLPSSQKLLAIA